MEGLWWNAIYKPKASWSLPVPQAGHATTIIVFVLTHLLM